MAKPLQIRNVLDEVHEALRRRAREAGLSLSGYALGVLTREVQRPTVEEVFAGIEARGSGASVTLADAVAAVHAERGDRE
ncbi:MAG: FitA-like ribbon-helix-helix domain-containing protein [Egibacteraceae bacterium]